MTLSKQNQPAQPLDGTTETPANGSAPDWQQQCASHVWMPYCQMQTAPLPVAVESTSEVYLHLADGRRLIDGMASWWTACHGYNHPHILAEIEKQLKTMPHVMFGGVHHPQALRLAKRLSGILPGDLDHTFFCDSGSVAVEVAMKMSVQYWMNKGEPSRTKFVSFENAYHGDTANAMSVCDPANSMHNRFAGFLPQQFSVPIPKTDKGFGKFDQFISQNQSDIAAVIIEPLLQGAGGMKFHSHEQLARLHRITKQHKLLFIADEIATGFGRTGTMFACEQADIVPDIICIGKALTGGTISMAATVATHEVYNAFLSDDPMFALMHGPTFMANPLACAAANASLDIFETDFRLQRVSEIESKLLSHLATVANVPGVIDIRCKGAVGVVQVQELGNLDRLRQRFIDNGVFLRPFRDMIYLTPSLSITDEQLEVLCDSICKAITNPANSFVSV